MNAAELRALREKLLLVQPLFAEDQPALEAAAEVLELLAWAEEEQREVHKRMSGVEVVIGWGAAVFEGDTSVSTLRRAREVKRG